MRDRLAGEKKRETELTTRGGKERSVSVPPSLRRFQIFKSARTTLGVSPADRRQPTPSPRDPKSRGREIPGVAKPRAPVWLFEREEETWREGGEALGKIGRECGVSCSSVTCILVRMRPKDVVHSRLYRPLAGEEKEDDGRAREEPRWRRAKERNCGEREDPRYVLLNGVGVPADGGVSFKNIPVDAPPWCWFYRCLLPPGGLASSLSLSLFLSPSDSAS